MNTALITKLLGRGVEDELHKGFLTFSFQVALSQDCLTSIQKVLGSNPSLVL